jgi:hypothetical protein
LLKGKHHLEVRSVRSENVMRDMKASDSPGLEMRKRQIASRITVIST